MTVLEILKGARELIATPEKWTQGNFARDRNGVEMWSEGASRRDPRCACFCLMGALLAATGEWWVPNLLPVVRVLGFSSEDALYTWNDAKARTHAEVVARLDSAIAKLKGEAQS